ncbi:MAG: polysaccharide pyruvyl transferase family protein [Bdellovibrionales bacterium]|nr:polysaccharide pyruvyl transferase family protein [Bdellovibrionales bacterium]
MNKKILLVNDTSEANNWGCKATTKALKQKVMLHGSIVDTFYLKELKDFSFEYKGLTYGVPKDYKEFVAYESFFEDAQHMPELGKRIQNVDVVFINGEGSVYDLQVKGVSILFIAYLAKHIFKKEVHFVNHTVDLSDPVMQGIVSKVYPILDHVAVREPVSYREVKSILPYMPLSLVPDYVFDYVPDPKLDRIYLEKKYGINIKSKYVCVSGSSFMSRKDRPEINVVELFTELCKKLSRIFDQVVVICPCGPEHKIFTPMAEKNNFTLVPRDTPTEDAISVLSQASLYVGGRWHPSIFAVLGGTPLIKFSANTQKTRGIIEMIGLEEPCFDVFNLENEMPKMLELAKIFLTKNKYYKKHILRRVEVLKKYTQFNHQIGQEVKVANFFYDRKMKSYKSPCSREFLYEQMVNFEKYISHYQKRIGMDQLIIDHYQQGQEIKNDNEL